MGRANLTHIRSSPPVAPSAMPPARIGQVSCGSRFWALLALIMFGVVLIFVHTPAGAVIYSILRLVRFAALTVADFHRGAAIDGSEFPPRSSPASIFLDAVNVFQFFLAFIRQKRD